MFRLLIKPALLLAVAIAIASCNKDDENPQNGDPTAFYVEFTADGTTIRYENGVDDYGNGPGISTYEDSIGRLHSEFTTFIKSALDSDYLKNNFTIQMVKFFSDTLMPPYSASFAMFDVGTYGYGSYTLDSSTAGIDGVVISYIDSDSTFWSSDVRNGSQESWANFEITSHKASGETQFGGKTQGTFNCRVFNANGEHLDLMNGSFYARTIYPQ
ncbi:MAG: hypothetical protein GC178_03925 [Flavobacteriales bacterium]|nr:hypothetical protein [Flavobacteriales bacterium]